MIVARDDIRSKEDVDLYLEGLHADIEANPYVAPNAAQDLGRTMRLVKVLESTDIDILIVENPNLFMWFEVEQAQARLRSKRDYRKRIHRDHSRILETIY